MLNIGDFARLGQVTSSCRELYHEWHDDDTSANVMELQQPIAR